MRTEESIAVRRAGWPRMRAQQPIYIQVNTGYNDPPLLFSLWANASEFVFTKINSCGTVMGWGFASLKVLYWFMHTVRLPSLHSAAWAFYRHEAFCLERNEQLKWIA